jgi:hypothetical protein
MSDSRTGNFFAPLAAQSNGNKIGVDQTQFDLTAAQFRMIAHQHPVLGQDLLTAVRRKIKGVD